MHRVLYAALVLWSMPAGAVAQSFQFMAVPTRQASLLPLQRLFRGYAASADLDGDGRVDLVVGHDAGASIHLGTASGWAAPTGNLGLPGQKPVLVDLDYDGDLDLAFVPPDVASLQQVRLYENAQGRMTPIALPAVMLGVTVPGVGVGRLDGDSVADLVVATLGGPGVPSLVLVRGGPGLQYTLDLTSLPAGLPVGLWPEVLDADGDGDLDILASNATSGLRLVRNDGTAFVDASATLPPARVGHRFLVSADLDGDGRTDCAAALDNGDVDVLWGAASGLTFAAAVASVPHAGLRGLWPADFDGDGDLDILAEHQDGLDVLWNQGLRRFARGDLLDRPTSLRGTGDVDGDRIDDVLFAAAEAEAVLRCKYQARGEDAAFAAGIRPNAVDTRCAALAGDIDGDGRTDLVTPEWSRIVVDHALGSGVYRRTVSPLAIAGAGGPWRAQLADMDGDNDLDLVVKDDTKVSVAANDGTGAFTWSQQVASASAARDDLRVGDVDGDGDLDIVQAENAGVVLIRNLGGGQYAQPVIAVPPGPVPHCVELADVDRDGDLDVIADTFLAGGHRISANDGSGHFASTPAFSVNLGILPQSVRAADFDADGDDDLLVAAVTGMSVHRNNGAGVFTNTTAVDLPPIPPVATSNLVVADLDGDGDLDAAALRSNPGNTTAWLLLFNNGSGRFVDVSPQRGQLPVVHVNGQVTVGDIDDDGDADLMTGSLNAQVRMPNHLRQCRSNALPRLGGIADLQLYSGPGFGTPGLVLVGVAFAPVAAPLSLPGLAGRLELDPATLQVVAMLATSSIGVSSAFVPVPQDAALFGLEVWFQGAILPSIGPPGFTNSVYEVVLR